MTSVAYFASLRQRCSVFYPDISDGRRRAHCALDGIPKVRADPVSRRALAGLLLPFWPISAISYSILLAAFISRLHFSRQWAIKVCRCHHMKEALDALSRTLPRGDAGIYAIGFARHYLTSKCNTPRPPTFDYMHEAHAHSADFPQ